MTKPMTLPFARLDPRAFLPQRMSSDAAGLDLRACLKDDIILAPGERALIPTGLQPQIPPSYEGQVRPRSGLALRHGVTVLNAPGTVDADYRGELGVVLINHGAEPFVVRHGERIAQLLVAPVSLGEPCEVEPADPSSTERGAGGYGSTGRR